jgi:hypothetical protein
MSRKIWQGLIVMVGLMTGLSGAHAQSVRFPASGNPAFSFTLGEGWSSAPDEYGNMRLGSADKSAFVQLSMIADAAAAGRSPSELAAGILSAAKAAPYSSTAPAQIGGVSGQAFFSSMSVPGMQLPVKIVILKLDATHFASVGIVERPDITPAATASLNAELARIRVTGAGG